VIGLGERKRVLVVANPATRRTIEPILAALRSLAPVGIDLDIHVTRRAGEARDLARKLAPGAAMVVVIGGDGTVADVATSLDGSAIPLAIVAAGSTNIIGRQLAIPTDPAKAAALIWGHHALRTLDAGYCNGRVFLHMAGVGFDSRLFAHTNPALKQRIGWMAYLPAAVAALRARPARFTIVVDGEIMQVVSPLVLVANGSAIIHPAMRIHPAIDTGDGLLDLIVVMATTPIELARTVARLVTGGFAKSPFVRHWQAREIEVTADRPMPVEIDGDVVETLPARFRIVPRSIQIVVPPR
jgi:diacylglycerol kinase (ATP)